MGNEGNTEGTPQPGDSVETERRASGDWSHLQEDYERIGSLNRLARFYGTRNTTVREELVRQGIPLKPRGHVKGQKKSDSWREASRKHWEDPEWREQQRVKWLERLPAMQAPRNGGSPLESYLHRALRKAGISFSTQRPILGRYVADILVTQKPVVIEADGNMHLHAKARERDAQRDADMRTAGYEVFRFPGGEICRDADGCIQRVIEAAGLTADAEPVFDIRNGLMAEANPRWKGGKKEWTCEVCGDTFWAWPRGYGKPCRTCSRECQAEWQKRTRASVATRGPRKDSRDPEHAEQRAAEIRARWAAEDRESQMMLQSGLHGPCEDVQSQAEMTWPAAVRRRVTTALSQQVPSACGPGRVPDRAAVHRHLRFPDRRPGCAGHLPVGAGGRLVLRDVAAQPAGCGKPDRSPDQRPLQVPGHHRAALVACSVRRSGLRGHQCPRQPDHAPGNDAGLRLPGPA